MNCDPFQIFDVLDKKDFSSLLEEKTKNWGKTIEWKNYFQVDTNSLSNIKTGILKNLYTRVEETLISKGFSNPEICKFGYTNSTGRLVFDFHKHVMHPTIDSYKPYDPPAHLIGKNKYAVPFTHFWIAIFYPHDIYDPEGHGDLIVKRDKEDNNPFIFPSTPNSVVFHNGLYGHELRLKTIVPNKIRDALFTHWLCKYPS